VIANVVSGARRMFSGRQEIHVKLTEVYIISRGRLVQAKSGPPGGGPTGAAGKPPGLS